MSTIAVVATNSARVQSRNAKRIGDIMQFYAAFNLEYSVTGSYPDTTADPRSAACVSSNACTGGWSGIVADAALDAIMFPTYMGSKPSYPAGGGVTAAAGGYLYSSPWGPGTAPYSGITYPGGSPTLQYTLEGIVSCPMGIIWVRGSNYTNCIFSIDGKF
jgi:hypothetical protein